MKKAYKCLFVLFQCIIWQCEAMHACIFILTGNHRLHTTRIYEELIPKPLAVLVLHSLVNYSWPISYPLLCFMPAETSKMTWEWSLTPSFPWLSWRKVHAEEVSSHRRGRLDSQSTQAAADRHWAPQTEQGDQWLDPRQRAAAHCTTMVPQGEEQAGVQVKHKRAFQLIM